MTNQLKPTEGTEPTYIYIKGQGWVVQTRPSVEYIDIVMRGVPVRIERRSPEPHEHWHSLGRWRRDFSEVERLAPNFAMNDYLSYPKGDVFVERGRGYLILTFVPL
jgi:hypothetical protein